MEAFRLGERRVAKSGRTPSEWVDVERYTLRLRCIFFPTTEIAYLFPWSSACSAADSCTTPATSPSAPPRPPALYAQLLIDPVDAVVSWLDELQLGSASFARLLGVSEVKSPPFTDEVPGGETVEAKRVRFAYREGRDVLAGIDLSLQPGDRLAVVGPSGAGKSTIALLLAGIHPPREGSVEIGGVEASTRPAGAAARGDRAAHPGEPCLRGHAPGQPLAGRPQCGETRSFGGPSRGRRRGVGDRSAPWPRHGPRTARDAAHAGQGATACPRPARPGRPAHAGPRRGDVAARPEGVTPARALVGPLARGPHRRLDRPPLDHGPRRRPGSGGRGRADRRARHARGAARRWRGRTASLWHSWQGVPDEAT